METPTVLGAAEAQELERAKQRLALMRTRLRYLTVRQRAAELLHFLFCENCKSGRCLWEAESWKNLVSGPFALHQEYLDKAFILILICGGEEEFLDVLEEVIVTT